MELIELIELIELCLTGPSYLSIFLFLDAYVPWLSLYISMLMCQGRHISHRFVYWRANAGLLSYPTILWHNQHTNIIIYTLHCNNTIITIITILLLHRYLRYRTAISSIREDLKTMKTQSKSQIIAHIPQEDSDSDVDEDEEANFRADHEKQNRQHHVFDDQVRTSLSLRLMLRGLFLYTRGVLLHAG